MQAFFEILLSDHQKEDAPKVLFSKFQGMLLKKRA